MIKIDKEKKKHEQINGDRINGNAVKCFRFNPHKKDKTVSSRYYSCGQNKEDDPSAQLFPADNK